MRGLLVCALGAVAAVVSPGTAAPVRTHVTPAPPSVYFAPAHGEQHAVGDATAARKTARHMVEDLVADGTLARDWIEAKARDARRTRMSLKSPFHLWIVRFVSAEDVGEHGTELLIYLSEDGRFLKYSYGDD